MRDGNGDASQEPSVLKMTLIKQRSVLSII